MSKTCPHSRLRGVEARPLRERREDLLLMMRLAARSPLR